MRKGRMSSGYTIVELMIVLAVSSVLLVSGMLMLSGRQQKAQFNQSVHTTQSSIDQVINNSVTGYYAGAGKFTCSANATGPSFSPITSGEGTNQGCVFMGRAIQFGDGSNKTKYNIFNIAGLRLKTGSTTQLAGSLTEAKPIAISSGSTTNNAADFPDTTESHSFDQAFEVTKVTYTKGGSLAPIPSAEASSVVAFITDLPKVSPTKVDSDSRTVGLYVIKGTGGNIAKIDAVDQINNGTPANFVRADKVSICFKGPVNNAIITIGGGNNRQLSTDLTFITGADTRCA